MFRRSTVITLFLCIFKFRFYRISSGCCTLLFCNHFLRCNSSYRFGLRVILLQIIILLCAVLAGRKPWDSILIRRVTIILMRFVNIARFSIFCDGGTHILYRNDWQIPRICQSILSFEVVSPVFSNQMLCDLLFDLLNTNYHNKENEILDFLTHNPLGFPIGFFHHHFFVCQKLFNRANRVTVSMIWFLIFDFCFPKRVLCVSNRRNSKKQMVYLPFTNVRVYSFKHALWVKKSVVFIQ